MRRCVTCMIVSCLPESGRFGIGLYSAFKHFGAEFKSYFNLPEMIQVEAKLIQGKGFMLLPLIPKVRPTGPAFALRHSYLLFVHYRPFSALSHSLPDMTIILRPDFGVDGSQFPALPQIRSSTINQQVFTHRSYFARPLHIFEDHPEDLSPDNEKYEHLGDTVLGLTITSMLMEMFPGLRVGPSTKIRAMIVGNPTLAEISRRYRLPDHLRLHPAQAITLRASINIQADVFEAFVGGLYTEQGLDVVKKWTDVLFGPYAYAAYNIARRDHGLPPLPASCPRVPTASATSSAAHARIAAAPSSESGEFMNAPTIGHLALFNQYLQKANTKVEWIYSDGDPMRGVEPAEEVAPSPEVELAPGEVVMKGTKATPVWHVKVVVDGETYGRGRGNTKKAARNEAAKEGLKKMGIVV